MQFASFTEEYKSCILKCKNGKHFFRVPNSPKTRRVWLDKLGINSINVNSRVCDNHFSDRMLSRSGKRLTKTAIPDRNIPSANGDDKLNESDREELENIIDHLLCKDDLSNEVHKPEATETTPLHSSSTTVSQSSEESKSLLPQLADVSTNNNHACGITELPQFILVFTAFRAKDTFIIPPTELVPESTPTEPDSIEASKLEATKQYHKILRERLKSSVARQIKYVRHDPPKNPLQRERETQVDFIAPATTTEASVQCDLEEEETPEEEDSSQLEWINHIIQAHVINAKGDMYECHVCGEIAASYASKQKHSLIHKESSSLCFHCGLQFSSPAKLKSHEKRAHIENKFEIKKALRCPKFHCTKAFHSRKQLFNHIDQHTRRATEQRCSKCFRSFSTFFQLHRHKSRRNCWR